LVVGLPDDLADRPFDGFVPRHRRMVETIAVRHSVALLCIRPPRDESPTPSFAEVNDVYEVALPHIIFTSSRTARIASALRGRTSS
jgi:hypothetical protein